MLEEDAVKEVTTVRLSSCFMVTTMYLDFPSCALLSREAFFGLRVQKILNWHVLFYLWPSINRPKNNLHLPRLK